jgi:hypothetical protein
MSLEDVTYALDRTNTLSGDTECAYCRKTGGDNIAERGKHGKKHDKVLLYCRTSGKRFALTLNRPLSGARLSAGQIYQIIHHAAEGVRARAAFRLSGISKAAANQIIAEVGGHCQKVFTGLMSPLQLIEVQLDELWSFVKKTAADEKEPEQGYGAIL